MARSWGSQRASYKTWDMEPNCLQSQKEALHQGFSFILIRHRTPLTLVGVLQWPPLGPSCHPRADCWQSRSLSLMQARAAFAFSFLQLRGRCQSLFHPQDGLSAWTHSHGVQSSRRCYSGATPRHVSKLGNDMPISPLTDDSSLYWRDRKTHV